MKDPFYIVVVVANVALCLLCIQSVSTKAVIELTKDAGPFHLNETIQQVDSNAGNEADESVEISKDISGGPSPPSAGLSSLFSKIIAGDDGLSSAAANEEDATEPIETENVTVEKNLSFDSSLPKGGILVEISKDNSVPANTNVSKQIGISDVNPDAEAEEISKTIDISKGKADTTTDDGPLPTEADSAETTPTPAADSDDDATTVAAEAADDTTKVTPAPDDDSVETIYYYYYDDGEPIPADAVQKMTAAPAAESSVIGGIDKKVALGLSPASAGAVSVSKDIEKDATAGGDPVAAVDVSVTKDVSAGDVTSPGVTIEKDIGAPPTADDSDSTKDVTISKEVGAAETEEPSADVSVSKEVSEGADGADLSVDVSVSKETAPAATDSPAGISVSKEITIPDTDSPSAGDTVSKEIDVDDAGTDSPADVSISKEIDTESTDTDSPADTEPTDDSDSTDSPADVSVSKEVVDPAESDADADANDTTTEAVPTEEDTLEAVDVSKDIDIGVVPGLYPPISKEYILNLTKAFGKPLVIKRRVKKISKDGGVSISSTKKVIRLKNPNGEGASSVMESKISIDKSTPGGKSVSVSKNVAGPAETESAVSKKVAISANVGKKPKIKKVVKIVGKKAATGTTGSAAPKVKKVIHVTGGSGKSKSIMVGLKKQQKSSTTAAAGAGRVVSSKKIIKTKSGITIKKTIIHSHDDDDGIIGGHRKHKDARELYFLLQ